MQSNPAGSRDRRLLGAWTTLAAIVGLSITALGIASVLNAGAGAGIQGWPQWFRNWGNASLGVVATLIVPIVVGELVSNRLAAATGEGRRLFVWAGTTLATGYVLSSMLTGVFDSEPGRLRVSAMALPDTSVAVERVELAQAPMVSPAGVTTHRPATIRHPQAAPRATLHRPATTRSASPSVHVAPTPRQEPQFDGAIIPARPVPSAFDRAPRPLITEALPSPVTTTTL